MAGPVKDTQGMSLAPDVSGTSLSVAGLIDAWLVVAAASAAAAAAAA